MKSRQPKRQYTIRNLTPQIDESLRSKARQTGKSLNQVVLEVLRQGVGLTETIPTQHDLDHLAGTWKEDPEFDQALGLQDRVDADLWS